MASSTAQASPMTPPLPAAAPAAATSSSTATVAPMAFTFSLHKTSTTNTSSSLPPNGNPNAPLRSSSRKKNGRTTTSSTFLLEDVSFEKTIVTNNIAIHQMERGQYSKAIQSLTASFFSFRKAYRYHRQQQQAGVSVVTAGSGPTSPTAPASTTILEATLVNTDSFFYRSAPPRRRQRDNSCDYGNEQDQEEESDQVEVSVYHNPIYIPAEFAFDPESTVGFISSAITFNLALANHLHGMDLLEEQQENHHSFCTSSSLYHKKQIEKCFISAGKLYEYTLRLERARSVSQRNGADSCPPSSTTTTTTTTVSLLIRSGPMILMSILNNLGQLHVQLNNVPQSKKCFGHLQGLVLCWVQFTRQKNNRNNRNNGRDHQQHQHQQQYHDLIQSFMENSMVGLDQLLRTTALAA